MDKRTSSFLRSEMDGMTMHDSYIPTKDMSNLLRASTKNEMPLCSAYTVSGLSEGGFKLTSGPTSCSITLLEKEKLSIQWRGGF